MESKQHDIEHVVVVVVAPPSEDVVVVKRQKKQSLQHSIVGKIVCM